MFDLDINQYKHYYDTFASDHQRSRMKNLIWGQWGSCPTCGVSGGEICFNTHFLMNQSEYIVTYRVRPHWERNLIVYEVCGDCEEGKGYLLSPLRKCGTCEGTGQLQDQPSEQWWYEVWQATGENLWALNNLDG